MQSGIHRASYIQPEKSTPQLPFSSDAVRGVASDGLNQVLEGRKDTFSTLHSIY